MVLDPTVRESQAEDGQLLACQGSQRLALFPTPLTGEPVRVAWIGRLLQDHPQHQRALLVVQVGHAHDDGGGLVAPAR